VSVGVGAVVVVSVVVGVVAVAVSVVVGVVAVVVVSVVVGVVDVVVVSVVVGVVAVVVVSVVVGVVDVVVVSVVVGVVAVVVVSVVVVDVVLVVVVGVVVVLVDVVVVGVVPVDVVADAPVVVSPSAYVTAGIKSTAKVTPSAARARTLRMTGALKGRKREEVSRGTARVPRRCHGNRIGPADATHRSYHECWSDGHTTALWRRRGRGCNGLCGRAQRAVRTFATDHADRPGPPERTLQSSNSKSRVDGETQK
jgi:hypothetical protein